MGFAEDMDMKRPEDLDLQILKNVRATAGRSKKMMGELKNLKSKMYGIENDLKHLWSTFCDIRLWGPFISQKIVDIKFFNLGMIWKEVR